MAAMLTKLMTWKLKQDRHAAYRFKPADQERLMRALTAFTAVLCQSAQPEVRP